MTKGPTLKMKNRLNRVVITFVLIGFVILTGRIGYISVVQNSFFKAKATEQQLDDITVNPKRGTIYDRNMKVLAQSATVWTVFISPVDVKEKDRDKIAAELSTILGVDKEEVLKKSKKKNRYEVIKKKVEKPEVDKILTFTKDNDITCIHTVEDSKRYYPYGNFASTVIGFTGTDNQGLYGLEAYYDDQLKGVAGRVVSAKNAKGTDMPFSYEKLYEPRDGNSLVTSLDEVIQHYLEKALDQVIVEQKVKNRACGIVMDVNTGEVLAMSTKPDFDLNDPFTVTDVSTKEALSKLTGDELKKQTAIAREKQWKNKAITELYEPGSVFKIVTGSAALEEKAVSLKSTFSCGGVVNIAGTKMKCWKAGGHGHQDLTAAFVNSCNPAFISVGAQLGATKFFNYFKAYGMTEKTDIDLPGEEQSLYIPQDKYGPVQLASASFGQSNKITPLQMITAACTAVNGGKLIQPHVVTKALDSKGNTVKTYNPSAKRQVISEDTSAIMREVLEQVVSANGGSNAYVKGFRIGGKTGTSQKLDGDKDARVSSFVGFAPADDPKIAIMIMVDEPGAGAVYGSVVAAPAAAAVMSDTLPYLGIEPKYTQEELDKLEVTVPNVKGQNPLNAQAKLSNVGLKYRVVGAGDKVIRQVPAGGTMPRNGTVILYTEENAKTEKATVPDLVGLTPAQANRALTNAGLNIKMDGASEHVNAKVVSQDIAKDTQVEKGTVVTIKCLINGETG